jgi:hypothetical protein
MKENIVVRLYHIIGSLTSGYIKATSRAEAIERYLDLPLFGRIISIKVINEGEIPPQKTIIIQ